MLHNAVFRPGVAAAGGELLVIDGHGLVNRRRIERGVDSLEKWNDVGVRIANVANLEAIAVDIDDLQMIFPYVNFAQRTQLRARALEELQRRGKLAGTVVKSGERLRHNGTLTRPLLSGKLSSNSSPAFR